ncbi:MAG: gliding motility-associated C-terminal domain-containing protein [Chlorobi bacterium]|nr:gliding motility-associated C-terminal domain-containing protein [Chlorobiota bacterium]
MPRKNIFILIGFLISINFSAIAQYKVILDSVSVNADNNVIIGWKVLDSTGITNFKIYYWDGITWQYISDSVPLTETVYIDTILDPSESSLQYAIAGNDSTGPDPISPGHNTIFLESEFDFCNSEIKLTWNGYNGWTSPSVSQYKVYSIKNYTDTTEEGRVGGNVLEYTVKNLEGESHYGFFVRAFSDNSSSTSNMVSLDADILIAPDTLIGNYVTYTGKILEISFTVDLDADVSSYKLVRSKDYYDTYDTVKVIQSSQITDSVFTVYDTLDYYEDKYYYKLIAVSICNKNISESNIIGNLIIISSTDDNQTNLLNWYPSVPGIDESYNIYRRRTSNWKDSILDLVTTVADTAYSDDVSSLYLNESDGKFCYYIIGTKASNTNYHYQSNTDCAVQIPLVYIPNAFTPNGDGKNDEFKPIISYASDYNYQLIIYDRWGEKIFESKDITQSWNGTSNSKPVKPGVYIYYLNYSDAEKRLINKTGSVTVIYP